MRWCAKIPVHMVGLTKRKPKCRAKETSPEQKAHQENSEIKKNRPTMAFHGRPEAVEIMFKKETFEKLPARVIADPAVPWSRYQYKRENTKKQSRIEESF